MMGIHATSLPDHRRIAIEAEIELHLNRVSLLIARLDRADAPFEDLEDDDPAGDNIEDEGERTEYYMNRPLYWLDQSRGAINGKLIGLRHDLKRQLAAAERLSPDSSHTRQLRAALARIDGRQAVLVRENRPGH